MVQVDAELASEGAARLVAGQFRQQRGKARTVLQFFRREVARLVDPGIIAVDFVQDVAPDEFGNNDKVTRVTLQRRACKRLQIEDRHAG